MANGAKYDLIQLMHSSHFIPYESQPPPSYPTGRKPPTALTTTPTSSASGTTRKPSRLTQRVTPTAAVLLHDCVLVPKDSPKRSQASHRAAHKATSVLRSLSWPSEKIEIVEYTAIRTDSYSAGLTPISIEGRTPGRSAVLEDATFDGYRCEARGVAVSADGVYDDLDFLRRPAQGSKDAGGFVGCELRCLATFG